MTTSLDDPRINRLLARLDELVRWRPGSKGEYLNFHSALERIQGNTNHFITGRRGSGKTRLLDELRVTAKIGQVCVVSIGAEDFKELTYPDILIQILRAFINEFRKEVKQEPEILSTDWWSNIYQWIIHPVTQQRRSKRLHGISTRAAALSGKLDELLSESDELDAEYSSTASGEQKSTETITANLKAAPGGINANLKEEATEKFGQTRTSKQREIKRTKVERLLSDFKILLSDFCAHYDAKIVLAVDDFYFIRREDQPKVIDYMHRICKDTRAYLKVATIKHRTELFEHFEVARGVVPGHEIQPIDLELPLGEFESIKKFLQGIWDTVCGEVEIENPAGLFMGDGFQQAVLASGGVPRDFFGIVKEALLIARERRERGVGKLRINEASRTYAESTKFPELMKDIARDPMVVELLVFDIVRFAREEKKKNCFYIDIEPLEGSSELRHLIDALVDSRLIHLISNNTSSSRRTGRYAGYLLDVGLYGHPARRSDRAVTEVKFWERDKQGRLISLSRAPIYPLRSIKELEKVVDEIRRKGVDIRSFILEPATNDSLPTEGSEIMQSWMPFVEEPAGTNP